MKRFTRVALRGSRRASTMPLTKLFSRAPHKLLAGFDGDHATKPSRRWQPPRVTSITSLQLDHLVPLDATSQCNALESHSLAIGSHSCKTSELEGSQALPKHGHSVPRVLNQPNARAPPLFIDPMPNRVVGAKLHFLRGHRTQRWWHRPRGGGAPQWSNPMASLTSRGHQTGGGGTRQGVAVSP
jgi:hypothetical protein